MRFKVPATSANLGPGFDCLGIALALYDEVEMRQSNRIEVTIKGEGEKDLPRGGDNLMVKAAQNLFWRAGKPFSGVSINVKKSIPIARGLGSSSAAIVAGLYGANALLGSPYAKEDLLNFASHLEGHPDNVAPALLGGFTVAWMENGSARALRFDPPALQVVLGIPDFQIHTSQARAILPAAWSKEDVVFSMSRASLLVAAMATGKYDLLNSACVDRLHEPYRGQLIPGYEAMRTEILKAGGLGVAISGSGPTVLAFTGRNVERIRKIISDAYGKHGLKSSTLAVRPSARGVH